MDPFLLQIFRKAGEIDDWKEFVDFVFEKPVLLSDHRQAEYAQVILDGSGLEVMDGKYFFSRIEQIGEQLTDLNRYPATGHPLFPIFRSYFLGELSLTTACMLASELPIRKLVSPIYLKFLSTLSVVNTRQKPESWRLQYDLLLIMVANLNALQPDERIAEEWMEMYTEVVCALLVVCSFGLTLLPDKRILIEATKFGEDLLSQAKNIGSPEVYARVSAELGILYLDPWFSDKNFTDYAKQFVNWKQKVYDFYGAKLVGLDPKEFVIPDAEFALKKAVWFLERSLEVVEVPDVYLYKALADAYKWAGTLGMVNDYSMAIHYANLALDVCKPDNDHSAIILSIHNIISFCNEQSSKSFVSHLQVFMDEFIGAEAEKLFTNYGATRSLNICRQLFLSSEIFVKDEWLTVWEKAGYIATKYGGEADIENYLAMGIGVLQNYVTRKATLQKLETDLVQHTEYLRAAFRGGDISEFKYYAELFVIAAQTIKDDQEIFGIEIMNSLINDTYEDSRCLLFVDAGKLLLGNLYFNYAVSNFNSRSVDVAIAGYLKSILLYISLNLENRALITLKRIEDICVDIGEADQDVLIAWLPEVALSIEFMQNAALTDCLIRIYKNLFIKFNNRNTSSEARFVLFQLMKGWSFTCGLTFRYDMAFWDDRKLVLLLSEIEKATINVNDPRELKKIEFISERLLVSTVHIDEPMNGFDNAARLYNLRLKFSKLVNKKLISKKGIAADMLINLDQAKALLGDKSILISQVLGPSEKGRLAVYNFIITKKDCFVVKGVMRNIKSEILMVEQDGMSLIMPIFGQEVIKLRKLINEEPEISGVSEAASVMMCSHSEIFLGGQMPDIIKRLKDQGKDHICFWPNGALHFYPFHLLSYNDHLLCEQFAVSYVPSIGLLKASKCDKGTPRKTAAIAVLGLTFLSKNNYEFLVSIPNSAQEAIAIAALFDVEPLIDDKANKASFINSLQYSKWVHLSTHGALNGSAPLFHALYLHPGQQDDGVFNSYELIGYDLSNVDVLTLSACETALGRFDSLDNLIGLPALFFRAGVKTIVGTAWEVDTYCSECFFVAFYSSLKNGMQKFQAFNEAQRITRSEFPDYRDWGAFLFIGAF